MPDSSEPMVSRLTRVQLTSSGALADPAHPETVLIGSYAAGPCPSPSNDLDCLPSEGSSHSIGTVRSAPDGTLWLGSGDASDFARVDPLALRTYDERSMAGKLLHVDRDGRGLPGHPFCPSDTNLDHVCTKLHSKGFRNPFRFNLRPGGGLTLGDVGWNTPEELDLIPAAGRKSYGWPCYEGSRPHARLPRPAPDAPRSTPRREPPSPTGARSTNTAARWARRRSWRARVRGHPVSGRLPGRASSSATGPGLDQEAPLDTEGRVTGVHTFAPDWNGTELGERARRRPRLRLVRQRGARRRRHLPDRLHAGQRLAGRADDRSRTSGTAPMSVDLDGAAPAIRTTTRSPTAGTSATAAPRPAPRPPYLQRGGRVHRHADR